MQHNSSVKKDAIETRRSFLKKSATAAAVVAATNPFITPVYGQNQAPSKGRVIGANDFGGPKIKRGRGRLLDIAAKDHSGNFSTQFGGVRSKNKSPTGS